MASLEKPSQCSSNACATNNNNLAYSSTSNLVVPLQ
jgi:hypothetical protein